MNIWLWVASGLTGYLLGAVSMARVIGRFFAPDVDVSKQEYEGVGDDVISFDLASATNVSLQLGPKYGCLVSLLDMLKVLLPTLCFRLAFPEAPYFLAAAAMGVVGHNFPVYYRFRGGAGFSSVLGGLLIVDWLAVPVTTVLGMILGMGIVRDAYAASSLWLFLLIPWFWIRTHDKAYIAYAVVVTVSFIIATIPLTKQYLKIRRKGEEALMAFYKQFHMGRGLMKIGRLFGLYKKGSGS